MTALHSSQASRVDNKRLDLVLASASPRRREMLEMLRVPFRAVKSDYAEHNNAHSAPSALVMQHARQKAAAAGSRLRPRIVLGADPLVYCGRALFGKPADMADAHRMLRALQGKNHFVYTGIALLDVARGQWLVDYVRTRVSMRALTDAEIARFFSLVNPLDKAGADAIQEAGGLIIDRIDGCYYNVLGFPVAKVDDMLKEWGHTLFTGK